MAQMKKITIHTDGGCHGNPGPGGWAAVLVCGKNSRTISGGEPATTNNRMELTAAIEALKSLKEPCEIELFTDSSYLKNGITTWLASWKRNGWKTKTRQPVKNEDLWRELDRLTSPHRIKWSWVKGHAGEHGNEKCDAIAQVEITRLKQEYTAGELKDLLEQFARVDRQGGTSDDELPFADEPPAPEPGKPFIQADLF